MRRIVTAVAVMSLVATGCLTGASSSERVVRVDFTHDEFASHYWRYFPGEVHAHPGDEIVFRQEWTGEPHTVTFGTVVNDTLPKLDALEKRFRTALGLPPDASDAQVERRFAEREDDADAMAALEKAEAEYGEVTAAVPSFFPSDADAHPSATQPCYIQSGRPPTKAGKACPERDQPEFDGRHAFYSSGYIPPSGSTGNTYRMRLADDIPPGEYAFYCVIHFPDMKGTLVVQEEGADLPGASRMNSQARDEIETLAAPLRKAYAQARAGRATYGDEELDLPMAGYHAGDEFTVAIDEVVPRVVRAKVDEPVTWTIVGVHTISFDVPRYVPIYFVRDDGTVRRNRVVDRAAGGSPKAPSVDFERHKLEIDGGTWDGSGFFSSGLLGSEPYSKYTLRVSKPGRYRYACLVHPKMVGRLVVED